MEEKNVAVLTFGKAVNGWGLYPAAVKREREINKVCF